MMTDWYERSIQALQLNGKGERTQQAYTRAVRMLVEFFANTPDPGALEGQRRWQRPAQAVVRVSLVAERARLYRPRHCTA